MAKSATAVRDAKQLEPSAKAAEKVKVVEKVSKPSSRSQSGYAGTRSATPNIFARSMDFLRDVRSELRKVVTPSRNDVRNMTTVVIITVFAIAFYFWVIDAVLGHIVQAILRYLGGTAQ